MTGTIDKRVEAIDMDDGRYIVMLRPGWRYGDEGDETNRVHLFGADTKREIRQELKHVKPCSCPDCQRALATTGKLWS